jgi:hypothetical protein
VPERTARSRQRRRKVEADDVTKAELVERAKQAGVAGYSQMTKAELATALS